MNKIWTVLFAVVLLYSCSKGNENTMYVKGNIKGLKKGTLYLQKQLDSLIISVDSVQVNGTNEFILTDVVTDPEMYYLTLGRGNNKIAFLEIRIRFMFLPDWIIFVLKAKYQRIRKSGSVKSVLRSKR